MRDATVLRLAFLILPASFLLAAPQWVSTFLKGQLSATEVRLAGLILIAQSAVSLVHSFFQGFQRMKYAFAVEVLAGTIPFAVVLAARAWLQTPRDVLLLLVAASGIASALGIALASRLASRAGPGEGTALRPLLAMAWPLAVASVSTFIYFRAGPLILSWGAPLETVTYYSLSLTIVLAATLPLTSLVTTVTPHASYLWGMPEGRGIEAAGRVWNGLLMSSLLFCIPTAMGLSAVAPAVVPLLFGAEYQGTAGILRILALYIIPQGLGVIGSSFLIAAGRPRFVATFGPMFAGATLLGAALLVPKYGVWGLVVPQMLLHSVYIGLAVRASKRTYGVRLDSMVMPLAATTILSAAAMYAVAYWLVRHLEGWAGLVSAILAGAAVFAAGILASPSVGLRGLRGILQRIQA